MTAPAPLAPLLIATEATQTDDPYDIVLSNIEVVNSLALLLGPDELPPAALISYYTDFYRSQLADSGFGLFAYNCECSPLVLEAVSAGLEAMGARRHAEAFEKARTILDSLSPEAIEAFLETDPHSGTDPLRDRLDLAASGSAEAEDDMMVRNAAYLLSQDDVELVPADQLEDRIEQVFAALPDRAEREKALEDEPQPEFVLLSLALSRRAGMTFERIAGGAPLGDDIAWHFITDKGQHHFIVQGDEAVLFSDDGTEVLRAGIEDLIDSLD